MTRPSIRQVNTLPWGRSAVDGSELADDGEANWELLRQSAQVRGAESSAEGDEQAYAQQDYDPAQAAYEQELYAQRLAEYEQQQYAQQLAAYEQQQYAEAQAAYEQQQYAAQQAEYEQRLTEYEAQAPQAGVDPFGHTVAHTFHAPEPNQFVADPFGAFPGEPAAVQASPSFAPGQMLAAQGVNWDEESLEPAAAPKSRTWLWGALAVAAVAVAGFIGMESMSAAAERDAKIAAAEQARQAMVAADTARLAEEAKVREATRLAEEARAREVAASGTSVSSLLAASVRSQVSAPMAARPTGKKGKAARFRKAGRDDGPAAEPAEVSDEGAHSSDPIYGL